MKLLARLKDRWAAFQDRRHVGRAVELLFLHGNTLRALRRGTEIRCSDMSSDGVAAAASGLKIETGSQLILLLPPGRFSTSEHPFSGLPRNALLQALHFQQDEYFPGMEPLAVAAGNGSPPGLALWVRRSEMDRWRQAFKVVGLELIAVGSTNLLRQYLGDSNFKERDMEAGITVEIGPNGQLAGWSMIQSPSATETELYAAEKPPGRLRKGGWKIRRTEYLFPLDTGRRQSGLAVWFLGSVLIIVLLLYALLPVVSALSLRSELEQRVAELRQQASDVLSMRGMVFELEDKLKPIRSFPHIRIKPLLDILDKTIPKDSWLTRLNVDESQLEIEGVSPDPSRIIELLSAHPEFSDVAFSKAISQERRRGGEGNSQFGIRMKLRGIDFDAWRKAQREPDE